MAQPFGPWRLLFGLQLEPVGLPTQSHLAVPPSQKLQELLVLEAHVGCVSHFLAVQDGQKVCERGMSSWLEALTLHATLLKLADVARFTATVRADLIHRGQLQATLHFRQVCPANDWVVFIRAVLRAQGAGGVRTQRAYDCHEQGGDGRDWAAGTVMWHLAATK